MDLEIRALPGVGRLKDLAKKVDKVINENMEALLSLDRICIEVLHNCKEEPISCNPCRIGKVWSIH
jgi:hypothetical protein